MFCVKCGAQVNDNALFCPACGAQLRQPDPQPQPFGAAPQPQYTPQPQYAPEPAAPQAPVYQPAPVYGTGQGPARLLRTNRSLLKTILLSAITFGIYGLVVWSHVSEDINTIASKYDGKHTMHYLIVTLLLGGITLGIVPLVWIHRLCNRIGDELNRRNIDYYFSAGTFWLWAVLGSLILVGPFVFGHKFFKAMNRLCENYNLYG